MSILIKGMEMPTSCDACRFFAWARGIGQHCAIAPDITFHATLDGFDVRHERKGDCPLVPVPPHGRLIDADALMRHCVMLPRDGGSLPVVYASYVRNAPTIIPASEEGE